jgi:hypothetical protein
VIAVGNDVKSRSASPGRAVGLPCSPAHDRLEQQQHPRRPEPKSVDEAGCGRVATMNEHSDEATRNHEPGDVLENADPRHDWLIPAMASSRSMRKQQSPRRATLRGVNLRNAEVRRELLSEVATLRGAVGEIDEVALGDAVEEVWHLLHPTNGGEPGDVLLADAEVALGAALWHALERAPWPAESEKRASDPAWADVVRGAASFLEEATRGSR